MFMATPKTYEYRDNPVHEAEELRRLSTQDAPPAWHEESSEFNPLPRHPSWEHPEDFTVMSLEERRDTYGGRYE